VSFGDVDRLHLSDRPAPVGKALEYGELERANDSTVGLSNHHSRRGVRLNDAERVEVG
jgi:hypothetical protein